MNLKKVLLTCIFSICLCINSAQAAYKVDVQSEKIPAGTVLKLKFQDMVSTASSVSGDQFSATLADDVTVKNNLVLPAGTILRGTVKKVKHTNIARTPGQVVLSFDHIVTPMGRQIPVMLKIVNMNNITKDGGVSGGGNYYSNIKSNFTDSIDFIKAAVDWGFDIGDSFLNGYPKFATVPVSTAGGVCASTMMFVGKSTADIFLKGNEVTIPRGKVLSVMLIDSLDVPLN